MDCHIDIAVGSLYLLGSLASLFRPLWTLFPALLFLVASVAACVKEVYLFPLHKSGSYKLLAMGHGCFIAGSVFLLVHSEIRPAASSFLAGSLLLLVVAVGQNTPTSSANICNLIGVLCFLFGSAVFFVPGFDAQLTSSVLYTVGAAVFIAIGIYFPEKLSPATKVAITVFIILVIGTEFLFIFDLQSLQDDRVSLGINYVAFAATFVSLSNTLPQLVHTYESNTVGDFNTLSLTLWALSSCTWLTYGIILSSSALILNNFVGIFSAFFLLWYKKDELCHFLK